MLPHFTGVRPGLWRRFRPEHRFLACCSATTRARQDGSCWCLKRWKVSLQRNDSVARFVVTDTAKEIPVSYKGILPDLFSEGKGVVAQGVLGSDGQFTATEVLAKHDENYMPPEAQAAVDKAHQATRTLKQ